MRLHRTDHWHAALPVPGGRRKRAQQRLLHLHDRVHDRDLCGADRIQLFSVEVNANFFWFLFCGFCLALSVIAPGMSFSTLLMPLGLYTPFVDGIGHFDLSILIPGGIGAVITVICLAKAINALLTTTIPRLSRHYRHCDRSNGHDHSGVRIHIPRSGCCQHHLHHRRHYRRACARQIQQPC